MKLGDWEFKIWYESQNDQTCAALVRKREDGRREVLGNDGIVHVAEYGKTSEAKPWILDYSMMQAMMDGLFKQGVRPQGKRYEDELILLKDHLADFKRLVFEKRVKG